MLYYTKKTLATLAFLSISSFSFQANAITCFCHDYKDEDGGIEFCTQQKPVISIHTVHVNEGLDLQAPCSCGNGRIDRYEECDDGNNEGGDNCDPNCKRPIVFSN